MNKEIPGNYQPEDFASDESFLNYYFQLDSGDQQFWEQWIVKNPGKQATIEQAKRMLKTLSLKLSNDEYYGELQKIKRAIRYNNTYKKGIPSVSGFLHWNKPGILKKNGQKKSLLVYVPVLLILFFSGLFLSRYLTRPAGELSEKYNKSNVPVVFMLSDNTVVTLAPKSTLRYPDNFNGIDRKVYLQGEAQFHVSRDIQHPFKVYSGGLIATVLGTTFNVRQQAADSVVEIELLNGKLKVETIGKDVTAHQPIILNPGERVVYNGLGQQLHKESWKQDNEQDMSGHIKFQQADFKTIAKELKAVFGVTVINQSNKTDWRFTGEFNNTTAAEVVENICFIKKLTYTISNDSIFIR